MGTFYNARNDSFLAENLLQPSLPLSAINTTDVYRTIMSSDDQNTYQKRFEMMGIGSTLSASILAGMVNCRGSSRYLEETIEDKSSQMAFYHTLTTRRDQVNCQFPGIQDFLATRAIHDSRVTHIVTEIEWGARSVVSAKMQLASAMQTGSAKDQFRVDCAVFASAIETLQSTSADTTGSLLKAKIQSRLDVTLHSDMLDGDDGILLEDLQEAYEYLQLMPLHVKDENGGKGWPVMYYLLPVEIIPYLLHVQVPGFKPTVFPASDCLDSFVKLFDQYQACRGILDSCQSEILANKEYLPSDLQEAVANRRHNLSTAQRRLKSDFYHVLESIRNGSSDPAKLWDLLSQSQKGELSPQNLIDVGMSGLETARIVKTMVDHGAIYIGHNNLDLADALHDTPHDEAYILYFSPASTNDESWKANYDIMLEILQTRGPKTLVAVVDCNATTRMLDKVHIKHVQGGQEISDDVLEDRIFMAERCFAACDTKTVETENIQPPIQRRHVTIPCPGKKCSVAKIQEWLCPRCRAPIEYGYSDQFIYCGCGRSLYRNYEFKCSNSNHGQRYVPYEPGHLLKLLNGLNQSNYLNILILGETGVGKSTFINAMVNYLEFETLDEAIDTEKLNYVIPCSFSTQIMDRENPNQPIVEKRVQIGSRDDEKDGSKGDSATQKTTVYPVTFQSGDSTLTVRLIDTPGIGDSRGVDYDQQNMADILSTISGYDTIHGILILLKSNNARLTITFRYCIKELLIHLHHNAAANMAFGFTNTRISNYTPGDTYAPLKRLLDEHPDVGLKLETPTTYCFDSESFRYLAAFKSDVTMPNKQDFDRSWSQSRDETIRLIRHFQEIPPHEVKNTMSLNGARRLIAELTKPLAEISQIINANIQKVEDSVQLLKDTRLKGDQLRNSLHVEVIQMISEPLPKPRTVCSHGDCTEVRDDGKGQNTMVKIYKSHCHPVCWLTDVEIDVMRHPGLIDCAAFDGNNCKLCGHHWQHHLHVIYELHEETAMVIDNGVLQQLHNHADDVTLKKTAIAQNELRVQEYKQEREIIRDTAAKFCVFLKNNSLVPYNDALIAYLDFLIKEEQAKVQVGGSDKRLLSLTDERHKHQEAIEVITRHMNSSMTWNDLSEGSIDRMVQGLYNLKHFGKNLQNLKQGITTAHQATYRERPYTVKRRNQSKRLVQVVQTRPMGAGGGHWRGDNIPRRSNTGDSTGGKLTSWVKRSIGI